MAKRVIMRSELKPYAKDSLQVFADHGGLTLFAITSRLVEWFSLQSETIQAAGLKRYPADVEADIANLLLEKLASDG